MPVPEWIFLPVLVGYFFFHASALFRYRSRRLDGPRLIIECALWGGMFTAMARALTFWLHESSRWPVIEKDVSRIPLPFVGTTLVALSLEIVVAVILNLAISKRRALDLASPSGTIQRFLRDAATDRALIAVTLDSRKVYIGFITEVPTLDPHDTHIAILPMLSGYRHHKTLELTLTSNYTQAYESSDGGAEPASFTVYMPITSIRTAGLFDVNVHSEVFTEKTIVSARA